MLTALVDEAFANNLDLRIALARIEAARAQVLLAQSYLYPSIDLFGDANRSRISANTSPPLPSGAALDEQQLRLSIQVVYELDVWGKYRSGASRRGPTTSSRRTTTARPCASRSPATSRARTSGCAPPMRELVVSCRTR